MTTLLDPTPATPIPGETMKQGWGVVRVKPWHLAGIFSASIDAEALAEALGPEYQVRYGDQNAGPGEFRFVAAPNETLV
jgi:hypothetical protein